MSSQDYRFRVSRRRSLAALGLLLLPSVLHGQAPTPLFTEIMEDAVSGSPPLGMANAFPVVLNLAALATVPPVVAIELPDRGETVLASLTSFEGLQGFDEEGSIPPGTPPTYLSYVWRGVGDTDGTDVLLTVVRGVMTGIITGPSGRFVVSRLRSGNDELIEAVPDELPGDDPEEPAPSPLTGSGVSLLDLRATPLAPASLHSEPVVVDVLVLFTNEARIEAGGDPANVYDDAEVQSSVRSAIEEANAVLGNSQTNVRLRPTVDRLDGLVLTGTATVDLRTIIESTDIKERRDLYGADIVSVILDSTSSAATNCGFARTQRKGCGDFEPIPGCDVGEMFAEHAFHWVKYRCLTLRPTLTHEVGHNLGCEHSRADLVSYPDVVQRASFPYSFGFWIDELGVRIKTMMTTRSGLETVLFFSNPDATVSGRSLGLLGEADNSLTIELLAPIAANFRERNLLYRDGFESGDLSGWSWVTGF